MLAAYVVEAFLVGIVAGGVLMVAIIAIVAGDAVDRRRH